jgi:hypothetical protein
MRENHRYSVLPGFSPFLTKIEMGLDDVSSRGGAGSAR